MLAPPRPHTLCFYSRPFVAPLHAGHGIGSVACAAKKKGTRIIVTLECTEARGEGKPPSRYTTQKVHRRVACMS